jgi:hypothetical protein
LGYGISIAKATKKVIIIAIILNDLNKGTSKNPMGRKPEGRGCEK